MASRIKVDEVTNRGESGAVAFPTGGANFSGPINVTGNIDFSGTLLQNGNPFVTLPTQDASNLGAVLRSGGTSGDAYWDLVGVLLKDFLKQNIKQVSISLKDILAVDIEVLVLGET